MTFTKESRHTEETKQKMSETHKRRWSSPGYREKMVEAAKNRPPVSEEHKKNLSKAHKKIRANPEYKERDRKIREDPEYRKRMTESQKVAWANDPNRRVRQGELMTEYWSCPEHREWQREAQKDRPPTTEEARRKQSETNKKRFADPEYRLWNKKRCEDPEYRELLSKAIQGTWDSYTPEEKSERVKKLLLGRGMKPNKSELFVGELLHELFPNEWFYTGDGRFTIGGKNPDFAHVSKNSLIEFNGEYWHQGENSQDRIDFFLEYGWSCLVIWGAELEDLSSLKEKIILFNQSLVVC